MDIVDQLVDILLDKKASISDRDDAAMDLGEFNCGPALEALINVATDLSDDESIMDVCGESIAQIWIKNNQFDNKIISKFHPTARYSALSYIEEVKPEWMVYFKKDNK